MSAVKEIVRARIDKDVKDEAIKNLTAMGLNVSEAIRLLMTQIANEGKFPFEIKIPNKATKRAINELDTGNGVKVNSLSELMDSLNA